MSPPSLRPLPDRNKDVRYLCSLNRLPQRDNPAASVVHYCSGVYIKYGDFVPKNEREQAAAKGEDFDEDAHKRLYAKAAWVFNVQQVDMPDELKAQLLPGTVERPDLTQRLAQADAFFAATGIEIREGGQRAFYRHRGMDGEGDFIQMPPRNLFVGTKTSTATEAYESTRLHELTHWAGAEKRLNRKFGEKFADHAYAFEELVAELSAAFLCAHLEITNTPRPDHAQYLAAWLDVLKADAKAVFAAASLASKATEYLIGLQPKPAPAPGDNPKRPPPAGDDNTPDTAEGPR